MEYIQNSLWITPVLVGLGLAGLCLLAVLGIKSGKLLAFFGFAYDEKQGIFYSRMNCWQRRVGYCRQYDEASPAFCMIIDSEPIRFSCGGKNWLIELWKGQYGMCTGGEIGIYYTRKKVTDPGKTLYKAVKDKDRMSISFAILKDGASNFARCDTHWWLTGFRLGEFSWPSELIMLTELTFPSTEMRQAFVAAIYQLGYRPGQFMVSGNKVALRFDIPYSKQPASRTPKTERLVQEWNQNNCLAYQKIIGDKEIGPALKALKKQDKALYRNAVGMGRVRKSYRKKETAHSAREEVE